MLPDTLAIPTSVLIVAGAVAAIIATERFAMPRNKDGESALSKLKSILGLANMSVGLFVIFALVWLGLFVGLFIGLGWTILDVTADAIPDRTQTELIWDWRFALAKLTALTGVLAAVVALPFTLVRLALNRRQIATAEQALLNDKMNAAVTDLYAQRQITKWHSETFKETKEEYQIASNGWEDDITRRNGAIDRLLGLVQENYDPDNLTLESTRFQQRIDRMLSVYVRELTREFPAKAPPAGATPDELDLWAYKLQPARSDMENAVQTLTRLPRKPFQADDPKLPDLIGANLQGFRLAEHDLQNANLSEAQLQGAHLSWAQLQGANLFRAQLQGAHLFRAQLQGADLSKAQLQGANLTEAHFQRANLFQAQLQGAGLSDAQLQRANLTDAELQGADLYRAHLQGAKLFWAQFDNVTSLNDATLRGAAFRRVNYTHVPQIAEHLKDTFGDASVKLPPGVTAPDHWATIALHNKEFATAWRAFQRSIGQDPDNPE